MRGLYGIEVVQTGRHRGYTERSRKICWPDAAVKNRGTVNGNSEPNHRLDSSNNGLNECIARYLAPRRCDSQSRGDHYTARCDRRRKMNVVNFAQPCQRAMNSDCTTKMIVGNRTRIRKQPPSFRRVCSSDPGADRVGHMQARLCPCRLRHLIAYALGDNEPNACNALTA